MHWLTNSNKNKLGLLTAMCLAACNESSAPSSTNGNAVDAAYAALVSEVAKCGKQVKTCLDAAGSDDAAVATCREEFGACRESAGKKATNALASAVRSCTSKHNACVKAAEHGSAGECQDELRVCLSAAHPDKSSDDADAGSDEGDARKGKHSDCLDEMHECVKADGPANACAEQVRMCVVDSLPSPLEVAPENEDADEDADEPSDEDADDAADEDMAGPGSGMPSDPGLGDAKPADTVAADGGTPSDPGMGKGKPADKGAAGDKASKGSAKKTAARICVETFSACVEASAAARSCAQTLKACRAAAKP